MIKLFSYISLFVFLAAANLGYATGISLMPLKDLHSKSQIIVLGQVEKVVQNGYYDTVTIKVSSYLKGEKYNDSTFTFNLITRSHLKDFDPELKKNQTGVFFLNRKDDKTVKAYWGSIAIFNKPNFEISSEK